MNIRITIVFLVFSHLCRGQMIHTELITQIALYGNSPWYGNGISLYDFNHDGLDDLTFADAYNPIQIFKNTSSGLVAWLTIPNGEDIKSIQWVDYDNDGDADLFTTAYFGHCRLHRNNGDDSFTEVSEALGLPFDVSFYFGSSWCDYDKDSWPDVYICQYAFGDFGVPNILLHNNGDGTFTDVTASAGITLNTRASFQSSWVDVDNNGWPDIYVANDKAHGNELFLNMEGVFVDASDQWNADVTLDSMCSTTGDYDNDGDEDIYLTNHEGGNFLLRNDEGTFNNVAPAIGAAVNSFCWGSLWLDIDHDTYQDLYVATTSSFVLDGQNFLLKQNSSNQYQQFNISGDNLPMTCVAKGDMNQDGFWDIMSHNIMPSALGYLQGDTLYWNTIQGGHNWVKIALQGIVSDGDAIGSMIEYFINGERFVRRTSCGEGFMAQDSQYEILSLGAATKIDSLFVHWPLGWTDKYENLLTETFYSLVEGDSYGAYIEQDGSIYCEGVVLTLDAGIHETYLWFDGTTGQQCSVQVPSEGWVYVTHASGLADSSWFSIAAHEVPGYEIVISEPLCAGEAGGMIICNFPGDEWIQWTGGSVSDTLTDLVAGYYTGIIHDEFACQFPVAVLIDDPEDITVEIEDGGIACHNGSTFVAAIVNGGSGGYSLNWNVQDTTMVTAGMYEVVVTDISGCSSTTFFSIYEPDMLEVDWEFVSPCEGEATEVSWTINGGTGSAEILWAGADPQQLLAGDYLFEVMDQNGCIAEAGLFIDETEPVEYNVIVNPSNATDGSIELEITSGNDPFMFEWSNGGSTNPLTGLSPGMYSCLISDSSACTFFTGNIEVPLAEAVNENVLVNAVFPNPFCNELFIVPAINNIRIIDFTGKIYFHEAVRKITVIDTTLWPSGIYILCSNEVQMRLIKL